MIGCGVGLLNTRDLKKGCYQFTLKVGTLIRMYSLREAVVAKEVIPQSPCHLFGSLARAVKGVCQFGEVFRHDQDINRAVLLSKSLCILIPMASTS